MLPLVTLQLYLDVMWWDHLIDFCVAPLYWYIRLPLYKPSFLLSKNSSINLIKGRKSQYRKVMNSFLKYFQNISINRFLPPSFSDIKKKFYRKNQKNLEQKDNFETEFMNFNNSMNIRGTASIQCKQSFFTWAFFYFTSDLIRLLVILFLLNIKYT